MAAAGHEKVVVITMTTEEGKVLTSMVTARRMFDKTPPVIAGEYVMALSATTVGQQGVSLSTDGVGVVMPQSMLGKACRRCPRLLQWMA